MNFALDLQLASLLGAGKLLGGVWLATALLYTLYLAYCTLRVMHDSGRLAEMPRLAQWHCYAILGSAIGLDIAFNVTVGSLVFLESPELKTLRAATFTARCKKHLADSDWRGAIARWVCNGWLNPGEPGHC